MDAVHSRLKSMHRGHPASRDGALSPDQTMDRGDVDKQSDKHIVATLIEERAANLIQRPLWPLYRFFLYPILKYRSAIRMADAIAPMSGVDALEHVSDLLTLDVTTTDLEKIPEKGRVLIAANHPTGIADGIAMYDALKKRRPDVIFFANRDAVRVNERFNEVLIPVEWVEEKRTRERSRETLKATKEAFTEDRCVVLFPSGRLAFMDENKILTEQEWMNSVAIFARKYDCPIIPTHVQARNSWLYYWFWRLSDELRDITLFNELLNKRGKPFHMTFGDMIMPEELRGDPSEVTLALRQHTVDNVTAGRPWTPIK